MLPPYKVTSQEVIRVETAKSSETFNYAEA